MSFFIFPKIRALKCFSHKILDKLFNMQYSRFNIHISFYIEMYYSIKIQCFIFIALLFYLVKAEKKLNPVVPYLWFERNLFYV